MHQRKIIRDQVVSLLKSPANSMTPKTAAVDRVFASRSLPLERQALPCINIYTESESAEIFQRAPRQMERKISLAIKVIVRAPANVDDALDAIALDVEHILMQDDTLGDVCGDCIYTGSEVSFNESGDASVGSCILSYDIYYYTYAVADVTTLNGNANLTESGVVWRGPNTPITQDDAVDTIDLT